MTGSDRIKTKILEEAKKSAEQYLSEAKIEAQGLITTAEKDVLIKITKTKAIAEEEAVNVKKRMHAVAGLENRKRILKVRQDMVGASFDNALEKAAHLPDEQYGAMMSGYILNAVREGEGEILLNERDKKRLGPEFVKKINASLKTLGKASTLRLSDGSIRSKGGFILKYGDMEINSTLEIIVSQLRPMIEGEVAAILFKA